MSGPRLEARLRAILESGYHDRHPFNQRMHAGTLTEEEIRTWVANRYYYQTRIPVKDEVIVAKPGDADFRAGWRHRIEDHCAPAGGLERWLGLARAVGLDPEAVASLRDVLPGVRRACDDYVAFVEGHSLLEGVAASLTELCAGGLMERRIAAFREHYPWVAPQGLAYFEGRTRQAPRDAEEAMAHVLAHATNEEDAKRCCAALERKCEILWSLLDGVEWASARPRVASRVLLREHPEPMAVLPERAVELNASGAAILALCDGERAVGAIASELRRRHPEAEGVERECYAFLEAMTDLGVLEA